MSVADLDACPECSAKWHYFSVCTKCAGTGEIDNKPCTNHSCFVYEGKKTSCYAHCCGFKKKGHIGPFSKLIGVEYPYDMPEHYDGVSEWECPFCHTRWGRWTGRVLTGDEYEPRYGGRRWKT